MISAIVFSRDRAMQLDLLLTSLLRNGGGLFDPISVIWFGEGEYKRAYETCMEEHPEADFIEEDSLTYQVRSLTGKTKAVTFLTDDSVLYREISLEPPLVLSQEDVLCFSLRLGRNTTICYPHARRQRTSSRVFGGVRLWRWEGAQGDFGYPMSLDGHIFRSVDLDVIQERHFSNPNSLEELMMGNVPPRPLMASFAKSALVGIPANRVQMTNPNRNGDRFPYSVTVLNERYLRGERIDLDALDFSRIRGAHQELEFNFR